MTLKSHLSNLLNSVFHTKRKQWLGKSRSYFALRDLTPDQASELETLLIQKTEDCADIVWVKINFYLQVIVVSHYEEFSDSRFTGILKRCEKILSLENQRFGKTKHFPIDTDPFYHALLQMMCDVSGLSLGAILRLMPSRRLGLWLDFSALVTVFDNIPRLKQPIEKQIGVERTEILFTLLETFSEAFVSGWSGSMIDLAHRYQDLTSHVARVNTWQQWESMLCGDIHHHSSQSFISSQRPIPVPGGPVEQYSDSAIAMTLGGFGFGIAATHSLEQASASIFTGVPKPARLGLSSYTQELSLMLSKEGVLVLNPESLTYLDRITALVIDMNLVSAECGMVTEVQPLDQIDEGELQSIIDDVFDFQHPTRQQTKGNISLHPLTLDEIASSNVELNLQLSEDKHFIVLGLWFDQKLEALIYVQRVPDNVAQVVINRARQLGLKLYIADHEQAQVSWLHPTKMLNIEQLNQDIAELQRENEVVLYVSKRGHPALAVADIGVAIHSERLPPAWHADILTPSNLKHVWLLLDGIERARSNSKECVELAKIEAVSGLVLSLKQLDERTIRKIRLVANVATFAAMINAVRNAKKIAPCPTNVQLDLTPWHALSVEKVLEKTDSSLEGLSHAAATARHITDLKEVEKPWQKMLHAWQEEIASPLTPILAAGAALSALTGSVTDAALITSVVVLNAGIGGIQRYQVDKALAQLDLQEKNQNRVYRDNQATHLTIDDLVIGDVLSLKAGELVPADCRLLDAKHLEVDESSLTGESLPVKKNAAPSYSPIIAERKSMLYEGTTIVQGRCHAIVVAMGEKTEARRSFAIQMSEDNKTGVEARLETLTNATAPIAAISGAAVMAAGLARNQPTDQLISSGVSLAVAAVPEGLPILSTVAQLASAKRLSQNGALVRNPRSIEALGRIDVLCADKTGTLTVGKLTLVQICDGFSCNKLDSIDNNMRDILISGLRASPRAFEGKALPHLTDQAIFDGATQLGITNVEHLGQWTRIYEKPFKSERGFHAVLGETEQGHRVYVKGAPDILLKLCTTYLAEEQLTTISDDIREQLETAAQELADQGLRILCVAEKAMDNDTLLISNDSVNDLIFRGFLALADPVRDTARDAIETLHHAGVEVMMITGDHPVTAQSIAEELGLSFPNGVLTGAELDRLEDDELLEKIKTTSVFARVTPTQKARIVKVLKQQGRIVAMTGDGANDAAAIRLADVGIALGEKSTPAARAAADLLVANEQIDTIVEAVLEGRAMWGSVKSAVSLLVGGNLGEIGFTLLGGLLDGRSPLNARQLLLVNLLTDALPALAVALRRPKKLKPEELLKEGPEQSLGNALTNDIQWRAIATGGAAAFAWFSARLMSNQSKASTVAMLALVGGQLAQTIKEGQRNPTVLATGVGSLAALVAIVQTPGLSQFFGCTPLGLLGLSQATVATLLSALGTDLFPELSRLLKNALDQEYQLHIKPKYFPLLKETNKALATTSHQAVVE